MSPRTKKIQVLGLGQACVDYLGTLPSYPREDEKTELLELHVLCGGPASSAMVTLSRLGVPAAFLGSISDDFFGQKILDNLEKEHVDVSCMKITPGYSSQFAFIGISRESGNRTIFWHRGSVPHLRASDVDIRSFDQAKILHVDSLMIEASIEAAKQARKLGMTVVMDAGTARQGTRELVKMVDVLIASESFAPELLGDETSLYNTLKALRRLGPRQVVITQGKKGSIGLDDQETVRQEAFSVEAVDTTGAGDVYHGGYVYGLLRGWDMARCMRFASATAALKCTKIGAQSGIPTLKTVQKFLEENTKVQ